MLVHNANHLYARPGTIKYFVLYTKRAVGLIVPVISAIRMAIFFPNRVHFYMHNVIMLDTSEYLLYVMHAIISS